MAKRTRSPARMPAALPATHPDLLPRVHPIDVRDRVAGIFSRRFVADLITSAPSTMRNRLLTIEVVAITMLHFVVQRLPAFLQIVDQLRAGRIPGLAPIQVSPQAFYERLKRIPHTLFLQLLQDVSRKLNFQQRFVRQWVADLAPFASRIFAIDDTTLDAIARRTDLLKSHEKGSTKLLAGRLGCAIDLVTGKFAQLVYDEDALTNEKNHIRPLIKNFPAHSLVVFDLGYFSFDLFDWITKHGHFFITRMRKTTTFDVVKELASGQHYRDRVVWLGKLSNTDRAGHPVRLVEILIDGVWYSYITNVLDPSQLSAKSIWALYAQRWTIEMCFGVVKRALNLAFLRSSDRNALLIQIWSTLTVYQVLQDLRREIAGAHGWNEDEVSWQMLMYRIAWYGNSQEQLDLKDWLRTNAPALLLKKRGIRKRRRSELPAEVLEASDPPPPNPEPGSCAVRTAYTRPRPKKAPKLIKGSLS